MTAAARLIGAGLRALGAVSPAAAGAVAERLFFTPAHRRAHDDTFLAEGRAFQVRMDGRRIAGWTWGAGPVALLVHGWSSRAARWRPYVAPLVAAGRTVVLFDAPGHGASGGRTSSVVEFARTIDAVTARVGAPETVIAHSIGGAATTLAMYHHGIAPRRVAFLAPAAYPAWWVGVFQKMFRLQDATVDAMKRRAARRLRFRWEDLDIPAMARAQSAPLLIHHDRGDTTVPWTDGEAIAAAWPGAELVTTAGLGHHDIVRDPAVMARTLAFILAT